MRYQDEQTRDDHPELVRSEPVPVPPPDTAPTVGTEERRDSDGRDDLEYDATAGDRATDEALEDRGTFDDRVISDTDHDGRVDTAARDDTTVGPDAMVDRDAARDDDRDATLEPDGVRDDRVRAEEYGRTDDTVGGYDTTRDDSGTDASARDALTDRGTFDDPVVPDERTDHDDLTAVSVGDGERDDERPFREPAPQPTAFGAATVGGAAAAAAMAGRPRSDVPEEEPTGIGDGAVDDRNARHAAAGSGVDERREGFGPEDRFQTPQAGAAETVDRSGDGQPVGEAAPATELLPGDVPAAPVAVLIAADAAQGLRDRWREVQLRFVDDPRSAATDAQALVNEAVEALTSALAAQRNDLGGWQATQSGDTEQLRIVVRRYREFLNRLLDI